MLREHWLIWLTFPGLPQPEVRRRRLPWQPGRAVDRREGDRVASTDVVRRPVEAARRRRRRRRRQLPQVPWKGVRPRKDHLQQGRRLAQAVLLLQRLQVTNTFQFRRTRHRCSNLIDINKLWTCPFGLAWAYIIKDQTSFANLSQNKQTPSDQQV